MRAAPASAGVAAPNQRRTMTTTATPQLCRERAASSALAAREATLDNVRERHLVAEKVWLEMAERSERVSRLRDERYPPVAPVPVMAGGSTANGE